MILRTTELLFQGSAFKKKTHSQRCYSNALECAVETRQLLSTLPSPPSYLWILISVDRRPFSTEDSSSGTWTKSKNIVSRNHYSALSIPEAWVEIQHLPRMASAGIDFFLKYARDMHGIFDSPRESKWQFSHLGLAAGDYWTLRNRHVRPQEGR